MNRWFHIWFAVAFALLAHTSDVRGAGKIESYGMDSYDKLDQFPDSALKRMADTYHLDPSKSDSALVCLSILTNRYYQGRAGDGPEAVQRTVDALYNMSYLYFVHFYDYPKAYSCLLEALKISEEHSLTEMYPYIYMSLGNIYSLNDRMRKSITLHAKAIEYYRNAFTSGITIERKDLMLASLINLIQSAMMHDEPKTCLDEVRVFKGLEIPQQPMLNYARHKCEAAEAYFRQDYARVLDEAELMRQSIDYEPVQLSLEVLFVEEYAYLKMRRPADAVTVMRKAEGIAIENGARDNLMDVYRDLGKCYRLAGDSLSARGCYMRYLELNDSLLNVNLMRNINDMAFLNQLQEVNDQVKSISEKKRRQQIVLAAVVALSVLLVAILAYIIHNNRILQRKNRDLYQKTVEILAREERERETRRRLEESEPTDGKAQRTYKTAIADDEKDRIYRKVISVMEDGSDIFSPDFTMVQLAGLTESNYKYVSQVINDCYGDTFYTMLSEYRVKEACRRIADNESYGNLTLEAIAASVGFKSRSRFVAAFKKFAGLTPSEYKKMAAEAKAERK